MRAARLEAPGRVRLVEVPDPVPAAGEVLVRVRACGVCGSDLNAWHGVAGIDYPLPPGAPGHEVWGEVAALGPDPAGKCLPSPSEPAGKRLPAATDGHGKRLPPALDANGKRLPAVGGSNRARLPVGQPVTGLVSHGLAELCAVPADQLLPLPTGVGAPFLGEPLACAANVARRAAIQPDQRVAIVGFGYLAALLVQVWPVPPAAWIAISRRPDSRQLAQRLGAEATYAFDAVPSSLWDSLPVVIEAAGVQPALDFASWLVAYGGRLVIAGYHADGPRTVNLQTWNWKGIDVINAHERDPHVVLHGLQQGLEQVQRRGLALEHLISHRWPLAQVDRAFQTAAARPSGYVKGIVEP